MLPMTLIATHLRSICHVAQCACLAQRFAVNIFHEIGVANGSQRWCHATMVVARNKFRGSGRCEARWFRVSLLCAVCPRLRGNLFGMQKQDVVGVGWKQRTSRVGRQYQWYVPRPKR
ncbi:hypothetical protein HD554DRAFT_2092975 [Boletus coccyginus]|nr:hypothetical protein HD554DRAFT_2092975 [Boletus coccyginus]